MDALILAAGSSRRLRPLCDSIPKSLITLEGKSLIEWNIDTLLSVGITHITIVAGYLKDVMMSQLQTKYPEIRFVENPIFDTSGSGYSLYLGIQSLGLNTDLLFMDADVLYHCDIIKDVRNNPQQSFAYVGDHECDEEAVKVVTDSNGLIQRISKNVELKKYAGESVGMVKVCSSKVAGLLQLLKTKVDTGQYDFEWEHMLDAHLDTLSIYAKITTLPWIEIDFPEDIEKAKNIAKELPQK